MVAHVDEVPGDEVAEFLRCIVLFKACTAAIWEPLVSRLDAVGPVGLSRDALLQLYQVRVV